MKHAIRNAEMRQRRAGGALLRDLAAEFGLSLAQAGAIVAKPATPPPAAEAAPAPARAFARIRLDAASLAEIRDAKRHPAPPYKGQGSWPGRGYD